MGRLEPSFDRRAKTLLVKSLHLEPAEKVTPPLVGAMVKAIENLVRFLGGEQGAWRIADANPREILTFVDAAHRRIPVF